MDSEYARFFSGSDDMIGIGSAFDPGTVEATDTSRRGALLKDLIELFW